MSKIESIFKKYNSQVIDPYFYDIGLSTIISNIILDIEEFDFYDDPLFHIEKFAFHTGIKDLAENHNTQIFH